MNYKLVLFIIFSFILQSCNVSTNTTSKKISSEQFHRYSNSGFALVYNESLENVKILDKDSLFIYHKSLKRRSFVKITNPINGISLIAEVKSNNVKFSNFYNSILSQKIADILELDLKHPFVELVMISKNSTYVAKKAKTFDEEKVVAEKAPIDGILISDLNMTNKKKKKIKNETFSYSIKVADFYYENTAKIMIDKIKKDISLNKTSIIKLSNTKYRVLIGPFNDIKSLRDSFDKMDLFNFENLEIVNNV